MKRFKHIKWIAYTLFGVLFFVAPKSMLAQPGYHGYNNDYNRGYNNDYNSGVSFQTFYDELSPYGDWVNDREYGYMWIPNEGPNFQPYSTNGYWTMTEYGNTWVSNYSWGWAPFHYGRWEFSNRYGWAWIPDYEWGPAWVNWREGSGYYGWAPLGINVSINIPMNFWVFVGASNIFSNRLDRYYVHPRNYNNFYNRTTIINNTVIINNRNYVGGPRRSDIERNTGSRVSVRNINDSGRPGASRVRNNSIDMYRPSIDRNSRTDARPSRITDASTRTRNNNADLQNRNDRVISSRDNMTSTRGNRELYIDGNGNASVRSNTNSTENRSTTTGRERVNNNTDAVRTQNRDNNVINNNTGNSRTRSNSSIESSSNSGNTRGRTQATESWTNSGSMNVERSRGTSTPVTTQNTSRSERPARVQSSTSNESRSSRPVQVNTSNIERNTSSSNRGSSSNSSARSSSHSGSNRTNGSSRTR
ncbi:hypothetical protein LZQ00_01655 [Sphingobacterium sp. SRCM116780]|uniref:DUF6600 domain-containing protein n=1 Tax=Sphingobacterium sp. SRCM116780 TaxID=2907623 RepID=UPI001F302F5A|nr:DUF6600 domain-containing protein [Sphingobacterium sp. SRCM116780]UIR56539.1 hypothetical protein LZQ00_01655 [Sphingobacterium sp. SRCM116780]